MSKKKVVILIILVFLFGISVDKFLFTNKKEDLSTEKSISNKSSRPLSMMLETGSNTGQYELTTRSTWPTDGYIFNTSLSNCENGSQITWDETNATITYHGNKTDKCYIYFDKYSLAIINNITEEISYNQIKVTLSSTQGTKAIAKYYYSSNNGTNYTESTSNVYTFTGLSADTTYNIKAYAVDEKGKTSEVYTKSVKTSTPTLAEYVKSQYTGTQGENNIYYHNGTIKSGDTVIDAGDNSYRYAGAYDDVNNYVCFGSVATTCPTNDLYRIIGAFGDQVKLIKADYATSAYLGRNGEYTSQTYSASSYVNYQTRGNLTTINGYYWNNTNETFVWSDSALNMVNLNTNYLSYLGKTWTNKIAQTDWKVGEISAPNIKTSPMYQTYQNEIVSPTTSATYSAKIGLMYVSDYGYAASPTYWTYKGYDTATTDYRAAINYNWMYMGIFEWTITEAFTVESAGVLWRYGPDFIAAVRPVFYLNSNVTYTGGTGTSNDPIRIE